MLRRAWHGTRRFPPPGKGSLTAPDQRWPVIRARELAFAAGVAALFSVGMSWPLVLKVGSVVPHDNGDPLLQTWQLAWIGHALLHHPLQLFQANTFWPLSDSLAFSDALIGYAPAALVAQVSPHAAVVVYDLLFLFAYALAFLGAYLLARELGLAAPAALVTGAAFAYAPWRAGQDGHLHVLSSGAVPIALALLIHGYRRGSPRAIVAGWIVAAWQVTLGFTFGIQLADLLIVLGATVLVAVGPAAVRRRLNRRLVVASLAGVALLGLVVYVQARPYLRVAEAHPEAKRTLADVHRFSPPLLGFAAAPSNSLVWGGLTANARKSVPFPDEQALFPGLVIVALAWLGLFARVFPRRLRVGLGAGVAACIVLSIGVRHTSLGYVGAYRLLYEFVPGWGAIRTPARLNMLTSLGLALLAGAGATAVVAWVQQRVRATWIGPAAASLLAILIIVEGRGRLALAAVPVVPPGQRTAQPPVLNLPSDSLLDLRYTLWSTDGFPPIANGSSGFEPAELTRLREAVRGFPDRRSVRALRAAGIRSVVLHPSLAAGTPWSGADRRPVDGLPLTRARLGTVFVYRLTG